MRPPGTSGVPPKDIAGMRFGRLLVLDYAGSKNKQAYWRCRCDCGVEIVTRGVSLRYGSTLSCGCKRREAFSAAGKVARLTHGKTAGGNQPVYRVWSNMMTRCYNKNVKAYKDYGGRGIVVCPQWHTFSNFLRDMGEPPPGLSLDRSDNDGIYEPSNCQWATKTQQARNRRSSKPPTPIEWSDQ